MLLGVQIQVINANTLYLSPEIFNSSDVQFVEHDKGGGFGSYLSIEVKLEPVADLFRQLLISDIRIT